MSAKLHLVTPDQCLVDHLTQALSDLDRETLRKTLLVVPTQRLGTALLVRLLESRSAMIPPEFVTLEALIRRRRHLESSNEHYALAQDATIDLLLRAKLEETNDKHLKLGHERELRLLYGELYDHGLRADGIESLKATIAEDIYKNDSHLGSLYDRALEIAAMFDYLDEALEDLKLRGRSHKLAENAQELSRQWLGNTEGLDRIIFLGFTSMAKSWQVLLPTILVDERVSLWLSESPKLYHKQSPLKELLENIASLSPTLIHEAPLGDAIKTFHCYVAPSLRDEVKWAFRIASDALSKSFSAARIGILITDERLYGTAIRSVFEDAGIETNIALPESWGGTLAGRHLAALLQFWQERETLPALLAFIDHPLTEVQWRENPDHLQRLRRGLLQAAVPKDLEAMRNELKAEHHLDFDKLCRQLNPLKREQILSLTQWLERLDEVVLHFGYWESFQGGDILQSSRDLYDEFAGSLKAAATKGPLLSGQTFWDLVDSHLLKGSVRGTGEPLSGLQIMSLSEARYFPFDLAIILGCHEGCFPKSLPQDELLDNYLKKRLGLPGWEMLEAMEDQTFHLLKARLPNLILLRSARHGEELLVRSRFTEALLARNQIEETVLPNAETIIPVDQAEVDPEGQLAHWLEQSTSRMSASRLDKLIHCPYSFLLDSLGIHSEASKIDESDTRREGEWLHAVLQTFVTGLGPKTRLLEPFARHSTDETKALERLISVTELMATKDLKESALLHQLRTFSWPRYIKHLYQTIDANQSLREYAFGQSPSAIAVSIGGRTRELHGRIDALDFSSQWTFVTDFKRRTVPALDRSKKGLNAQLALYAMSLEQSSPRKPFTPLVLGYWNIYEGKWTAHGITEGHRELLLSAELCTKSTPTVQTLTETLKASWEWREQDLLSAQRFYADPGEHCRLCDYTGLCRKDDPRMKTRVALQNALAIRLETLHA